MKANGLLRMTLLAGLGLAGALSLASGFALVASPASAQFWDPFFGGNGNRPPRPQRPIPQQQQQQNPFGGFFQQPFWQQQRPPPHPSRAQMGDFSKAPPPRKPETPPTTTVLVMGDGMADWLGSGLEEAYVDTPEFGVTRKVRANSGLIRNESRTDSYDWVQAAREFLGSEKPDFVVMMIGLSDRQSIRERAPARPAGKQGQPAQQKQGQQAQQAQPAQQGQPAPQGQQNQPSEQDQQQNQQSEAENGEGPTKPEQAAPEASSTPSSTAGGTYEFRSDKWDELYAKRIDEMMAALKSKGVPVVWVGLPPIRGQRSRSDVAYLNDLYRARAQKAGITFVDVWDGFVDEDSNFSLRGPDYNGQIRQLRSADGVYFTKAGALKLGHYVEREIQRLMASRGMPVALPEPEPQQPAPAARPGVPVARPVSGPVVPLTASTAAPEDLAGNSSPRAPSGDPVASRVLQRGEPAPTPSGRADDFSWPRADADDTTIIPATLAPTPAPAVQRPGAKKGPQKGPQKGPAQSEKGAPKRPGQAATNSPLPTLFRPVR